MAEENSIKKETFEVKDLKEKDKIVEYLIKKGIYSFEQLKELFESSYILIPFELLKRKDLSLTEKILCAELVSLSRKNGYCYATNEYLGEKIGLSRRNISRILKKLKEKKIIKIELIKNSEGTFRKIWIEKEGGMTSCHTGVDKSGIRDTPKCHAKRDTDKRNKQNNIICLINKTGKPTTYGNEDINYFMDVLKTINGGFLDGSEKTNRRYCWLLLLKCGYKENKELAKKRLAWVIKTAEESEFHRKNLTSFRYIYNNLVRIVKEKKLEEEKYKIAKI
ncbi:MAG: helix-turn-helix domain-containing protein [Candidatus Omnitrophica bacterium]|nr:helix-turn-helix domain-containing protein [Candidatus Omnitrophota bacterium]